MKLKKRLETLQSLKEWMTDIESQEWQDLMENAYQHNKWFTKEFITHRLKTLADHFLDQQKLDQWVAHYSLDDNITPRELGIILPGNIPLDGFHDLIAGFVVGHHAHIKLSDNDTVLVKAMIRKLIQIDENVKTYLQTSDMLQSCDAYLATVDGNRASVFETYLGKYPSIIRKKKSSVAVLNGKETVDQLTKLGEDIFLYFGLGMRNVSKLYVPTGYDFVPLLQAFDKFKYFETMDKYKNFYDYHLSLLMMNKEKYICNDCLLLTEDEGFFPPVSEIYYAYYDNEAALVKKLQGEADIERIEAVEGANKFGEAYNYGLFDYQNGVDIVHFLLGL